SPLPRDSVRRPLYLGRHGRDALPAGARPVRRNLAPIHAHRIRTCLVASAPIRGYKEPIMSRAFVKESDDDLSAGELPERPLPAHANYVTPKGLELLQARVRELSERHEQLKRQSDENS